VDFAFTDEQRLLRESVRSLMETHAPPAFVREIDREGRYPYELYERWVEAGLLALPFAEAFDGLGGSVTDMTIVAEEIARHSADVLMAYAGSVFCGLNIVRKGSPEQQSRWIPRVIDGTTRMAIAISEPEAGSDVGAMRTKAVRDGDDWIVSGQKLWVTGAGARDCVLNVYLKTDTSVDYRRGMSLFLIDNDAPGVELRKLDMLGRRATGTYEVFFHDVRVPADRVVGGENSGWSVILSGLQAERIVSAAGSCGGAQASVDLALAYAKERVQFGRPIGTNQSIAHMLADMQTEVDAARTLMWRAAWMVDQGRDALREISMAKLFASETYVKVANLGMQIFGAYGYNMEYDMQRHFRESRSATIAAGSSQMQRNIIAGLLGVKVATERA
jgi:alkylation response protein AidB-like acyl-CoA dehydrogenase